MESITASVRIQDDRTREEKEGELSTGRTRTRRKKKKKLFSHWAPSDSSPSLTEQSLPPPVPPQFDCCHRHRQTLSGRSFAPPPITDDSHSPPKANFHTAHTLPSLTLADGTHIHFHSLLLSQLTLSALRCVVLRWSLLCFALPCASTLTSPHLNLALAGKPPSHSANKYPQAPPLLLVFPPSFFFPSPSLPLFSSI